MDEGQTNEQDQAPPSKEELLKRIRRSRSALEETIAGLSEEQLARPGPEGWSIKDHLAHMAIWELGIVALLRRQPRFEAMGGAVAVAQGKSEDEVNDRIYRQHDGLSVPAVLEEFRTAHNQMLQILDELAEEDLFRPYADYVTGGQVDRQDPVFWWIVGNTYEHFDEHHNYIQALLEEAAA